MADVERRGGLFFDGANPVFVELVARGAEVVEFVPGPPLSSQRAVVLRAHLDGTVAIQPEFTGWVIVDATRHVRRTARARVSDPSTSHAAVAGVVNEYRLTGLQVKVLEALAAAGTVGMTDHEHQQVNGLGQDTAGKRRGELVAKLLVRDTGRKRMTPRGQLAKVWEITVAGRQALRPPGPPPLAELAAGAAS